MKVINMSSKQTSLKIFKHKKHKQVKLATEMLLEGIGEDLNREGLKDTPSRVAKAWEFWTSGYSQNPKDIMTVFENPSKDNIDQMIVVPKIDFYSQCEHHLATFYGQVHIAYLPNDKVLGVSKFARLTEIYARRLQIQERMGQQIAEDVMKYLKPKGVGVIVKGIHMCMRSRGVQKQNSEMITSIMLGCFRDDKSVKDEFTNLVQRKI